jgi:glutamate dehydrogenase/leucine dehydrogenase
MDALLKQYKEKQPEVVFEWSDAETGAKGWVVINSLRGGAAGGGTRMRKGLTKDEVLSLAKVMEVKFSVCGPAIGGAKSGIDFDPRDPRKIEVLKRWFKAVMPLLKNYYGTGGDLNVDELKDVIPITESYGLWHPQEGVVNGHLKPNEGARIAALGQLRYGVSNVIRDKNYIPNSEEELAIADMVTGYGVAMAVVHFYDLYRSSDIKDKKVIIQGWGNVASAAAFYLAQKGAKIVGIIDIAGGIIRPEGLSYEEVCQLFLHKKGNNLHAENMLTFEDTNAKIWDLQADIFIPGAASKILNQDQMDRLMANGLDVMSCGANVPFVDDEVFFGPTARYTDEKISIIPDFIANCGMARVFAYLMQAHAYLSDKAIFDDISVTIRKAIETIKAKNSSDKGISTTALTIALEKLMG